MDAATPDHDTDTARAESLLEAKRERGIPAYQLTRPAWGVEITGTIKAFGGTAIAASQAAGTARGFQIQAEYQPPFLQAIGVLSLGPSVAIYPVFPLGSVTGSPASLWSVGGQLRYQARFFREQPVVPVAGFEMQYLTYAFSAGASGRTVASGPFFGGMLLLNLFEPSSAAEMFVTQGISRSYLVAELRNLSGSDENVSISGASVFFGLRFEF